MKPVGTGPSLAQPGGSAGRSSGPSSSKGVGVPSQSNAGPAPQAAQTEGKPGGSSKNKLADTPVNLTVQNLRIHNETGKPVNTATSAPESTQSAPANLQPNSANVVDLIAGIPATPPSSEAGSIVSDRAPDMRRAEDA